MDFIIDLGTVWKLKEVHPELALRWKLAAKEMFDATGRMMRVTEGLRSFKTQLEYYKKGRILKGNDWIVIDPSQVVTHAKPGQSFHNYGLAVDSCFRGADPYLEKENPHETIRLWTEFGKYVSLNGMVWGGNWVGMKMDRPHAELTFGLSLSNVQMIFEQKGIDGVFASCNLELEKPSKLGERYEY